MSQEYEIERMLDYLKTLDPVNAKILEGLGRHDPRNISLIAESIGIPQSTVAYRFKKLVKEHDLEIFARLDWTKLGLMKTVVIAEAFPGRWKTLWKVFEDHDYLTYLVRCFGRICGCYALFSFPAEYREELRHYLDEARKLQLLSHYLLFWTANSCEVHPNFDWFDFEKRKWAFKWQQWVEEVLGAPENLSRRLMDPEAYTIAVDEKDLIMLKELEQDGIAGYNKLAKAVGITPQSVAYRYQQHIIKRELIIDHDIGTFPYPHELSDMCSFTIEFENERTMAKLTNCLYKPFVLSYAKVIGQNSVVVHTYTPKMEFPKLIESLDSLVEMNLIRGFSYVTLSFAEFKDNPLPHKLFKEGAWQYDLSKDLGRLRKIASSK